MNDNNLRIMAFTNNTASEWWRFHGQAERMNENTQDQMFVAPYYVWDDEKVKDIGTNLVILEQLTNPLISEFCKQNNIKVVFESDDAMIDSYGRERKNLQALGDAFKGRSIETIAKADAVTVTNHILAENYARFTKKPIYVLPNYVDYSWYEPPKQRIERITDEIRIGWFGSRGHFEDLRSLIPVLEKILEKYPNVRFIYCGYGGMSSDKKMTEIGWGEDVFKELPRSRREFVIAVKPDLWPIKHQTLDLDIGLCPLIDDYFNKCKTNIKWLEYAVMGTPAVCSNILYSDYVKHGKDGMIASTEQEWYDALSYLIENKKARKEMGKLASRRVDKDFNLDKHWKEWTAVYREIVFNEPLDANLKNKLRYQ